MPDTALTQSREYCVGVSISVSVSVCGVGICAKYHMRRECMWQRLHESFWRQEMAFWWRDRPRLNTHREEYSAEFATQ